MQSPPLRAAKDLFLHVADEADWYYNAWRFHVKKNLCSHWLQRSVGRQQFSVKNTRDCFVVDAPRKDFAKTEFVIASKAKQSQTLACSPRIAGWTKNVIIMEQCKDDIRSEFYVKTTKKFGWTKDVLINQLEESRRARYEKD